MELRRTSLLVAELNELGISASSEESCARSFLSPGEAIVSCRVGMRHFARPADSHFLNLAPMDLAHYLPMLLDDRPLPLTAPGWIFEIMYDGYRLTAMFGDGECRLRTRGGANATAWFPEIAKSLASVRGGPYVVDGEISSCVDLSKKASAPASMHASRIESVG